jgi:mannose/fructose/N-acetylgalactosamine-specific phosphotransferase system component IID
MKKNMGNPDRIIRIVVAVVLAIGAGLAGFGSVGGIILLILAAVMLATSAMGFCPLYAPFKFSTKRGPANS